MALFEIVIGALLMVLGGFSAMAWVRWRAKFQDGTEKRDLAN